MYCLTHGAYFAPTQTIRKMNSENISYVLIKGRGGTKQDLLKVEDSAYCFCVLMVRKQNKQTLERQALNSIHKY